METYLSRLLNLSSMKQIEDVQDTGAVPVASTMNTVFLGKHGARRGDVPGQGFESPNDCVLDGRENRIDWRAREAENSGMAPT